MAITYTRPGLRAQVTAEVPTDAFIFWTAQTRQDLSAGELKLLFNLQPTRFFLDNPAGRICAMVDASIGIGDPDILSPYQGRGIILDQSGLRVVNFGGFGVGHHELGYYPYRHNFHTESVYVVIIAGETTIHGAIRDIAGGKVLGNIKKTYTLAAHQETLGELATNGVFAADTDWTKGTGWTIAAGVANKSAGTASDLYQASSIDRGHNIKVEYEVSNYVAGTVTPQLGSEVGSAASEDGLHTDMFYVPTDYPVITFSADAAFDGAIDNVHVTGGQQSSCAAIWADKWPTCRAGVNCPDNDLSQSFISLSHILSYYET